MTYGNPVILPSRGVQKVKVEIDGYRPGARSIITQTRFLCVGGPVDGAHRAEVEHSMHDYLPRNGQPIGYRRFNNAGRSAHSSIWVWLGE